MIKRYKNIVGMAFFILLSFHLGAQADRYQFKRNISYVDSGWHKAEIPYAVLEKLNDKMSDLRIYGFSEEGDTLEIPYKINYLNTPPESAVLDCPVFNQTTRKGTFYYTLQGSSEKRINELELDLADENFDWKVNLEGSSDQKQWFSILENYRIVGIHNELTQYHFTTLRFNPILYPYLRLSVKSLVKPTLNRVYSTEKTTQTISYKPVDIKYENRLENKENKKTCIELFLKEKVPVGLIQIEAEESFDFYRNVSISYLKDSTLTEKGWIYQYVPLLSSIISSCEPAVFTLKSLPANQIRIEIENEDNAPLTIRKISLQGGVYELYTYLKPEKDYFLFYGNDQAQQPHYDKLMFNKNQPAQYNGFTLGDEQVQNAYINASSIPLVENKKWLWGIMGAIMLLMGWFTIRMLKQ